MLDGGVLQRPVVDHPVPGRKIRVQDGITETKRRAGGCASPCLLHIGHDLNYGNLLVGASSGSNHETLAQRQNGIHTKLYEALASGDTEAACRAVYAHYMEPMERMRSANSAGQAADGTAK